MYSTTQLLFLQSSPVVFLLIGLLHSPQFADKNPVFVGELSHTCGLNYPPDTLGVPMDPLGCEAHLFHLRDGRIFGLRLGTPLCRASFRFGANQSTENPWQGNMSHYGFLLGCTVGIAAIAGNNLWNPNLGRYAPKPLSATDLLDRWKHLAGPDPDSFSRATHIHVALTKQANWDAATSGDMEM